MKKLFIGISGLFGAVPGLGIMWKGIGTPPDYAFLFGGVIEAFGSLFLILLWMNRVKIKKINPRKVIVSAVALGVTSFLSLVAYLVLFNFCVVSHPTHHTIFFPLWTSGDLAILVEKAGGRWSALDQFGYFAILSAVRKMPPYALPVTAALLLLVYQSIFTTLATAFGLVGFHKGEKLEDPEANAVNTPVYEPARKEPDETKES